jgi:uncharacterized membrane protein YfcA
VSAAGLILAAVAMAAGTCIQGAIGFGTNLVAAPILALIDPDMVPVPVIISSALFNVLVAERDRGHHPWRTVRWPIVGLVPASVVGAAAVANVDRDELSVLFGVLVLIGVGLSVSGLHPRHTRSNLFVAGAASGFMGTTTGIGGPPIALMFQKHQGPDLRASLARFFGMGSLASLVPLLLLGQVHLADLGRAAVLIPGGLVGFVLSKHVARRLDHGYIRHAVLTVSAVSAVIVLVRAAT